MIEKWRPTLYSPNYEVSNLGRVRALGFSALRPYGNETRKYTVLPRVLKSRANNSGYLYLTLGLGDSNKTITVHRLVALSWVEWPSDDMPSGRLVQVNHIDGNKLNNHASNLEWVTAAQNVQHAFDTGLKISLKGEKSGRSRLTAEDVLAIRENKDNLSVSELMEVFNLSRGHVHNIIKRKYWSHI